VKSLNEFKDILKTSNTYLKTHMGFYVLWQFISLLILGVTIVGIYILFGQLKNITFTFGI